MKGDYRKLSSEREKRDARLVHSKEHKARFGGYDSYSYVNTNVGTLLFGTTATYNEYVFLAMGVSTLIVALGGRYHHFKKWTT